MEVAVVKEGRGGGGGGGGGGIDHRRTHSKCGLDPIASEAAFLLRQYDKQREEEGGEGGWRWG